MTRRPAPIIRTYTLPGVLTVLGPTGSARPLLLDSPHSGTEYPEDFGAAVDRDTLLDAVDTAVDELFGGGPELGAALLKAHFPRTYIDPNRAVDDLDARLIDGCWPGPLSPTEKTRRGNGLIRRTIGDDDRALYSRRLGVEEVQERIRRYHVPYHKALGEVQDRLMERFGAVYHLNCHSMGSLSRGGHDAPAGYCARRPRRHDLRGGFHGLCCGGFWAASATRCGTNHIFKGVELVRRLLGSRSRAAQPPDRDQHRPSISTRRRAASSPDFLSVQADLAQLVDRLAAFAEERANDAGRDVA